MSSYDMRKVTYNVDPITESGASNTSVTIVGNYWEGTHDRAIILLHMMPATKESWVTCAEAFHTSGYDVLAIDLRGHGESGGGNFREFTNEQHQASRQDVEGARQWLEGQGVIAENIYIGGASIGANLALQYLGSHPECKAVFCLSPGVGYRGIETLPIVRRLATNQRVLYVAAKDDARIPDNFEQTSQIYDATAAERELKVFETGGHGTEILNAHPDLIGEIITWIKKDVRI
jgi:pimeloyl-ACP methyl ester carboxylesterase